MRNKQSVVLFKFPNLQRTRPLYGSKFARLSKAQISATGRKNAIMSYVEVSNSIVSRWIKEAPN